METVFIILTVILWGIAPIFDKYALKLGEPFTGTLFRGISVGLLMAVVLVASGKLKAALAIPPKATLFFILSGITAGGIGVFTFYKALQTGSASKIVPLASTYPLVTALLSVLFLGETLTLTRLIGILLIVSGVWLVK
ncbi:MAG: EamA family transporter [Endomicrobiales bacterium]|nr:EamA family transporter [Endomicrobiales bacterium]